MSGNSDEIVTRERLRSLRCLIGDTPLLAIRCRFRGRDETVFAKFEVRNFTGSIEVAERFASENEHAFLPRQFQSPANVEAHKDTTGPEILAQLCGSGLEPTGFVAGVGTGGTSWATCSTCGTATPSWRRAWAWASAREPTCWAATSMRTSLSPRPR